MNWAAEGPGEAQDTRLKVVGVIAGGLWGCSAPKFMILSPSLWAEGVGFCTERVPAPKEATTDSKIPPPPDARLSRHTRTYLRKYQPTYLPHPPPCPSPPPPRGGTVTWPMNNKKSIGNHRRRRR